MRRNKTASTQPRAVSHLLAGCVRPVIRHNLWLTAGMAAAIASSTALSVLPPLILEQIVNRLTGSRSVSLALALGYFGAIVLSDVCESLQNASITIFGQKLTHGIRSVLCAKLDRLPADYFITHESGLTASVFTNDGDAIDVLYSDGIVSLVADCFRLIAVIAVVFTRSKGLALLLAAAAPLLFLFTRRCQKRMNRAQLDNRRAIARVSNHVPETLRCIRMIHVFGAERYMENTYDGTIQDSYRAVNRTNIIDSIYSPVILLTQAAVIAVMMIFAARGGASAAFFGVSVGSAVAMIAYVNNIFTPLGNIGMEITNIQAAAAAITHIEEFLAEPEMDPVPSAEMHPGAGASDSGAPGTDSDTEIALDRVTFGYSAARPVLKDLSFTVHRGENVTLAGRTGAGKSTIFRLLTGLYAPQEGTIRIGGKDPRAVQPGERRALYGCVEQQFAPVAGTVRDQITLFDPSFSEAQVQEALRLTGLSDTVRSLPQGLDTPMASCAFSMGQLQLLSIARAVVSDPKILLLDEITANLDSSTEARVIEALRASARGRTVLSISHRLSSAIGDTKIIEITPISA